MDCSLPGSSLHGILQTRVLEWVAISFSRGSSRPRDWTRVFLIPGRPFNLWTTRKEELVNFTHKIHSPHHGLQGPLDLASDVFLTSCLSSLCCPVWVLPHWLPCWFWNIPMSTPPNTRTMPTALVPWPQLCSLSFLQDLAQTSAPFSVRPALITSVHLHPHSCSPLFLSILFSVVLNHL